MAMEIISHPASGNIAQVGYDADSQELIVVFKWKSATYKYSNVSGDEANGFSQALSAGDYLNQFIVPQHPGERIS
ncbi:MAG TPA: KTSC domain-containing protein [Candidatus Acidoferrales bacterium]|nr:KTSC domain-containing protein [Candidatus Acidoferrales bacterium]